MTVQQYYAALYSNPPKAVADASSDAIRLALAKRWLRVLDASRATGYCMGTMSRWFKRGVPTLTAIRLEAMGISDMRALRPDVPVNAWPRLIEVAIGRGHVGYVNGVLAALPMPDVVKRAQWKQTHRDAARRAPVADDLSDLL